MAKINTIGVLTSGGDAPGMNAAILLVALQQVLEVAHAKGHRNGVKLPLLEGQRQAVCQRV